MTISDADRQALIEHTALTTPFSKAQIEEALAVVGDDPDVLALAEELARKTGASLVPTIIRLSVAVDTFGAA